MGRDLLKMDFQVRMILTLSLGLAIATGASAADRALISGLTTSRTGETPQIPLEHVRRFAPVAIDATVLASAQIGSQFVVEPFPGERYVVRTRRWERHSNGVSSWIGEIVNSHYGTMAISFGP